MTKTTTNSPAPEGRDAPKTKTVKKQNAARTPQTEPAATKQDRVLAQLMAGTTIHAMMQATGWQQHSVRGFLAGVVRKKLGLNLTSKTTEAGRVYRIGSGKPTKASKAGTRKTR